MHIFLVDYKEAEDLISMLKIASEKSTGKTRSRRGAKTTDAASARKKAKTGVEPQASLADDASINKEETSGTCLFIYFT